MKHALLLVLGIAFAGMAQAQPAGQPPITRHVVAGGGATVSSGSRFQLSSTVGQPATRVLTGNRFSIRQGFWIWRAPVLLPSSRLGTNFLLSLQTEPGKTYTVQYSDSPAGPIWQDLLNVTGNGAVQTVTNGAPATTRFFRVVE